MSNNQQAKLKHNATVQAKNRRDYNNMNKVSIAAFSEISSNYTALSRDEFSAYLKEIDSEKN